MEAGHSASMPWSRLPRHLQTCREGCDASISVLSCSFVQCMSSRGLAFQVGWKHQDAVAELEEKRKVKSSAYYQAKKKLIALKAKAAAEADA